MQKRLLYIGLYSVYFARLQGWFNWLRAAGEDGRITSIADLEEMGRHFQPEQD